MAVPMQAMNGVHPTPPSSATNASPAPVRLRPTLPDKRVTSTTIEDAYVSFILYCNPAVPLETDANALREAFRVPPKSDGKSFSTFTLFELINKLESKELKTWAELALKLGVTPPDQEKNQSSQKIQQYAVRLKRWMHSMHVDAFFDYLLDHHHPYWTQIPTDPNPAQEEGRDGVAAEDDMALRALLPQIRPRRGRRKPEDDLNKSPSQRPRQDSPALNGSAKPSEPWTAHPDGRGAFLFPPADHARSSVLPTSDPAFTWQSDVAQTPMTAYPQSAMTPVNGQAFWGDPSEPRSAITPSKAKLMGRRHGAKVVSSAWRSGGSGASGKTRGRPPINRVAESPLSALPDTSQSFQTGIPENSVPQSAHPLTTPIPQSTQSATTPVPLFPSGPTSTPTPTHSAPMPIPEAPRSAPPQPSRPPRGRLSLQVPERVGGSVRLATPPLPVVTVNGESTASGDQTSQMLGSGLHASPTNTPSSVDFHQASANQSALLVDMRARSEDPTDYYPESGDMTHVREMESMFVSELLICNWYDAKGNKIAPCGFDEAMAVTKTIIGNMAKKAATTDAFLINLAALAGGSILQGGTKAIITRLEEGPTHNKYLCRWRLRYGSHRGSFSLNETVATDLWKKSDENAELSDSDETDQGDSDAQHWKEKYQELLQAVRSSNQQVTDLKMKIFDSLKNTPSVSEA
ncbi:ARS binding protein 2-domain-containing protein [Xylariales sp. AK1849]|nr:ARS binding protein 2-domain-containing protein [Xylariales sp. AK1849]